MEQEELLNHIRGALIGCAYGDAMGMPTEMLTREHIDLAFPEGVQSFSPSTEFDFIGRRFEAGEVTDDTVNTLLVCKSIIDGKGEFDVHAYMDLLRKWIEENQETSAFVIGPSTARALQLIAEGTPIEKAGRFGTTNGSAMKVSPIGLISDYHDMKQLVDRTEQLCLPTHHNSIAIAGASMIAAAVSYALRGNDSMDELISAAEEAEAEGRTRGFQLPGPSLCLRTELLRKQIREAPAQVSKMIETEFGMGMETVETVPAVLAIVELAGGKPMKAARIAANIAGDTDTAGAIACAICGAMNPEFDPSEVKLLKERNHIDFDAYAKALLPYVR